MFTIAIINEKGGTGKTTTAVSLSAALGSLGQRILLVDLDGQAASSRWLGVEEDNRLSDALISGEGLEPIENVLPGVSLAPATGKLDSVSHDLRPSQGGQLRKVLRQVSDRYDLTIIDCPPSLGNRLIGNALLAATHVIVPVETSILALDGLKILLTTLEDIREGFGHKLVLGGVLACRFDGRTRLSRLVVEELRRALPGKVFHTVIRENVRMRECPASGESILTFAPDSHAAEDYCALAEEMLARPEAWQQSAVWASNQAGQGPSDGVGPNVSDLRDHAAASIRAAAQSAGRWKPTSPAERPAELPDSVVSDEPAPETSSPPPDVASGEISTSLVRLTEAKGRLAKEDEQAGAASEATPPPPPEGPALEPPAKPVIEPPAKPVVEPSAKPVIEPSAKPVIEPSAKPILEPPAKPAVPFSWQGPAVYQGPPGVAEGPAEEPAEPLREPPAIAEEDSPEVEEAPAEPPASPESFPALRALLQEMEREGDPSDAEAATCGAHGP